MLAWDQFIGSDNVGRVPIERKLARVPAPRVFLREPKNLSQANITIDHRSQDHRSQKEKKKVKEKERKNEGQTKRAEAERQSDLRRSEIHVGEIASDGRV